MPVARNAAILFLSGPEIRIMNADSSLWVFKLCSDDRMSVYFFMAEVYVFDRRFLNNL